MNEWSGVACAEARADTREQTTVMVHDHAQLTGLTPKTVDTISCDSAHCAQDFPYVDSHHSDYLHGSQTDSILFDGDFSLTKCFPEV